MNLYNTGSLVCDVLHFLVRNLLRAWHRDWCQILSFHEFGENYLTNCEEMGSISWLTYSFGFFLTGFTASTISFPLEVARKRLMVGSLQGKCPPHMAAALSEVIQEEGLRGLYRGWGASCLKVMPSSGIQWMFYEAWKDFLLAEKQHF